MKPDWKDAPEWAGYLVHELDACWVWFQDEPKLMACGMFYGGVRWFTATDATPGPISIEPRPCKTT